VLGAATFKRRRLRAKQLMFPVIFKRRCGPWRDAGFWHNVAWARVSPNDPRRATGYVDRQSVAPPKHAQSSHSSWHRRTGIGERDRTMCHRPFPACEGVRAWRATGEYGQHPTERSQALVRRVLSPRLHTGVYRYIYRLYIDRYTDCPRVGRGDAVRSVVRRDRGRCRQCPATPLPRPPPKLPLIS